MKTIVIGMGNPYLTDDGVGIRVAREIREASTKHNFNSTDVAEACVGGLCLMEMMAGYEKAIIVDASTAPAAGQPGTITKMDVDELESQIPTQHTASAHDANLSTALAAGKRLGLPLPEDITIYGISVANVIEFGEHLTPFVERAVPAVVETIVNELNCPH